MAKDWNIKIGQLSKIILFLAMAAVAAIVAVDYWMPTWSLGKYVPAVFSLGAALFVFAEVSFLDGFKKKDYTRMIGAIVAIIAILGVVLTLFGVQVSILIAAQGFVNTLIAIYFVIEAFR